jgi:hypothetical protein
VGLDFGAPLPLLIPKTINGFPILTISTYPLIVWSVYVSTAWVVLWAMVYFFNLLPHLVIAFIHCITQEVNDNIDEEILGWTRAVFPWAVGVLWWGIMVGLGMVIFGFETRGVRFFIECQLTFV